MVFDDLARPAAIDVQSSSESYGPTIWTSLVRFADDCLRRFPGMYVLVLDSYVPGCLSQGFFFMQFLGLHR